MRTEQLKEFETNLSELNECYSHYIFVWEQFSIDYEQTLKSSKDQSTTEVFKDNTSNRQYNVLLSHLDKSHSETQNLILKSIYQLTYGYFEHYLIRLHQFGQHLDGSILDLQQKLDNEEIEDRKIFDKFLNRLEIKFEEHFNELEKNTLDYIRIRRNRIIHRATTTQGAILNIINNHGQKLNEFWDSQLRNKRYHIDFSRKNIDDFDQLELFDILNICRKLSAKIDKAFIKRIGEMKIRDFLLAEFIATNGKDIKGFNDKRKRNKFKMYCIAKFAYTIPDNELEEIHITVV